LATKRRRTCWVEGKFCSVCLSELLADAFILVSPLFICLAYFHVSDVVIARALSDCYILHDSCVNAPPPVLTVITAAR
jgi:hypothetical protein